MLVALHNLKLKKGSVKKRKRIGRGGKRGTYSGKGQKGQRSRSGGRGGLKIKGFKALMQRIPKLRGFKSQWPRPMVVNLDIIEKTFKAGDIVDIQKLKEVGLISKTKNGVKILGRGEITKKLIIKANAFSESAEKAIKKAGGEVVKI